MGRPIRLLHVDDEPDLPGAAAAFLEREMDDVLVETASSAEAGLARLESGAFDCVVSDYDIPGCTGVEFLRAVRDRYGELPFVLFTGTGSEEVASDAVSAGVTDYLQKGSGTDQYATLANRIENAVGHHRSQRALEESQRRLSPFIEQSPLGVVGYDESFTITTVNDAAEGILGYDASELVGGSWTPLVPEAFHRHVAEIERELLECKGGYHSVNENVRKDGERIVCEWHNRVVTDQDGDVVSVFSQFRDVTERQSRELRLERLHEATRELIHAGTGEGIADTVVRAADDILGFSIVMVRFHDAAAGGLVPVAASDPVDAMFEDRPVFGPESGSLNWRAYEAGEARVYDDILEAHAAVDGGTGIRSLMILPIGEYGTLSVGETTVGALDETDVSLAHILVTAAEAALEATEREAELRRRRDELERQNERLEEFAGVLSHDLRNPLNVAQGQLEIGREEHDDASFEVVAGSLDRMETLIENVLLLAREGEAALDTGPVALGEVLESCLEAVETDEATLVVETDRAVMADPARIRQAVENLVRNSVAHGGGNVTITVGETERGFYVEDDGEGIPEARRGSVFDPGFSTATGGTGFGLSIVRSIAEEHGWTVRVTEGTDGGARFEFDGVEFADR